MNAFRFLFLLEGTLNPDDRVGFLTRRSPKPPDAETLILASVALAIAFLLVGAWKLRRKEKGWSFRTFLGALAVASFLGTGVFCTTDLIPRLSEKPATFTKEPLGEARPGSFERFVRDLDCRIPEGDGVMLINCNPMSPREADTINYFLYPRRVIFRRQSLAPVKNPADLLDETVIEFLRAEGAKWLLDLRPEKVAEGAASALIPLPSRGGEGDG